MISDPDNILTRCQYIRSVRTLYQLYYLCRRYLLYFLYLSLFFFYTTTSVSLIKVRISDIVASLLIRYLSPTANPPEAIAA